VPTYRPPTPIYLEAEFIPVDFQGIYSAFSQFLFLPSIYKFCDLSTSAMASRRISAVFIAHTGRNGLHQVLPHHPSPRVVEILPAVRYLSTTPFRNKQEADINEKRGLAAVVVRGASKLFKDADSAVADLRSGSTILSSGFGLCGTAGQVWSSKRN
jgi:hypothetical protein